MRLNELVSMEDICLGFWVLEKQYNAVCYAWKIMVCGEREDGRKILLWRPASTCRGKMELNRAGREQKSRRQGWEHGSRRRTGPGGMDGGAVLEEAGFEGGGEVTWWLLKNKNKKKKRGKELRVILQAPSSLWPTCWHSDLQLEKQTEEMAAPCGKGRGAGMCGNSFQWCFLQLLQHGCGWAPWVCRATVRESKGSSSEPCISLWCHSSGGRQCRILEPGSDLWAGLNTWAPWCTSELLPWRGAGHYITGLSGDTAHQDTILTVEIIHP